MWLWLKEKLGSGKRVVLIDYEGEIANSIAYEHPLGGLYCYHYWSTKGGFMRLATDGTTTNISCPKWVFLKKWPEYQAECRREHLLKELAVLEKQLKEHP